MFSLKAVERGRWLGPGLKPSSGSVSDRFILVVTGLDSMDVRRLCEYFLVDMCRDGSLVEDVKAEGRRECECDGMMEAGFLLLLGSGRLLKVLLRGIPPMGSSGRQM